MQKKRKRQQRRAGDLVVVPLSNGRFGFGYVLDEPLIAFFDYLSGDDQPAVEPLVKRPIAFQIWVMSYAITRGLWPVVGHVQPKGSFLKKPWFFLQDALTGELTKTQGGGREVRATKKSCMALERAAVWDPEHVVERLEAHFDGRESRSVTALKLR